MKIAFVHYHLKTGGVTTVLRQQIEAIRHDCEIIVLSGAPPEGAFPADVVQISGLGYTDGSSAPVDPESTAESIRRALLSKWRRGCDVLHVHNPTLAKNIHFQQILKAVQKREVKLFLQIHDFAEDGRPSVYFQDEYVPDCHYGVINSRDYRILLKSGLTRDGLHLISNTINRLDSGSPRPELQNFVLYPVRARRRKNIGEAILLSLFFNPEETLAVTLPPVSPIDRESYAGWKRFVRDNDLRVRFEVGSAHPFPELVASSKYFITTSITEGFGFSFLEPWTADKTLRGRALPEICDDFIQNGIRLDHLYTRFRIPLDWIRRNQLFTQWKTCVEKTAGFFERRIPPQTIADSFDAMVHDGTIDFGLLNEGYQKRIITQALSNKPQKAQLIELNPFFSSLGNVSEERLLVEKNRQAVENNYSQDRYRENLLQIYSKVMSLPIRHHIDKKKLLEELIDLNNFSLLRWCDDLE